MSIKSLLLFLFLYVCLVWVGAAILKEGPEIRQFGLFWTAAGLIAVLAWIVIAWLWGWFRIARARAAAKPKTTPKGPAAIGLHEDDAALLALIQEAKISLAKATGAGAQRTRLADLPLYLLVGPENSGKTSTFLNSGLEPVPLSGQPTGSGQTIPTRLCNIWLARNALFVELGGRAFSGDLARWASLLRVLRGGSVIPLWRRLLKETDQGLNLRGIIAFCDIKEFTAASSPQGREKLERLSSVWSDRLGAITQVFGSQFPVYLINTKTDAVPHFADYFGRMRDPELSQVFGCSLPTAARDGAAVEGGSADFENKRLTKTLSPLLHRLAERRIVHLAHESDESRKPGIYEFPRELRRIRPTLAQFMVDVFRPHPLRHTPFLRGYYFTGTCEEELAGTPSRKPPADDSSVSDATAIFQGDATQVFQSLEAARGPKQTSRAGVVRRWAFVAELFTSVVLPDNLVPRPIAPAPDQRIDLYRKLACGAVCALCLFLCGCFLWSWVGNTRLLQSIGAGAQASIHGQKPAISELQSLDDLRQQAMRLLDYDRNGPPWRLRWGLYSGNALAQPARDLYFRRFQEMLLSDLNGAITNRLKAVPMTAGSDDAAYDPVSKLLKAHLMISSGSCKPDAPFVSQVLRQTLDETAPGSTSDWRLLADRQIEFYAGELASGNPAKVAVDGVAVERARGYLRSIQGADRIYAGLLSQAEKRFPNPQKLAAIASNYAQVLNGPGEVSGAFTPEGWNYVKNASKDAKSNTPGDSCIEDQRNFVTGIQQNLELERSLQRLFVRDYIDQWQKFVKSFSVIRYSGAADAARKLEVLADHKSPLLAVFALASRNTNFAPSAASPLDKPKKAIAGIFEKAKEAVSGQPENILPNLKAPDGQSEIANAFQPVQWVVPPVSETWVTDKNSAYMDALAQLGHSMQGRFHAAANWTRPFIKPPLRITTRPLRPHGSLNSGYRRIPMAWM